MNMVEMKWLEAVEPHPTADASSPTISQLVVELKVEADKWSLLGTHLEVPHWKLAAIEKEEHSCIDRLLKVLLHWQKNATLANPFTWGTVVETLRNIDNNTLADKIATIYK